MLTGLSQKALRPGQGLWLTLVVSEASPAYREDLPDSVPPLKKRGKPVLLLHGRSPARMIYGSAGKG